MSLKTEEILTTFVEAIDKSKAGTRPYDTSAEVVRTEGKTVWVHIPSGVDETPIKKTIDCRAGDIVQIRVSGGTAWIVGNSTAPPTDDRMAIQATINSAKAELSAKQALGLANEAYEKSVENEAEFTSAVITINDDIGNLQSQIDGNITTWFYGYEPTVSNAPASEWSADEKNNHLGDLFYDTSTGYAYRWMVENGVYSWSKITDTDVTTALANASKAQDTADAKRRVFINTPTVPYDVGDLWCVGSSGDILTCTRAKTSTQSYSASDWSKLNKYTDDSAFTAFLSNTYATDKTDLQSQIDGKAETWYQSSDPSTAWTTTTLKTDHKGDLWYNTSTDTTWYWSGTAWQQQNIPTAVFDKIDGKAQIFTSQPTTPYSVGDLWFNSNTSDIMVCTTSRATGNYTASDWEKRDKYTDDTQAVNAGIKAEDVQKDVDATNQAVSAISGEVDGLSTALSAYETSNDTAISNLSSSISTATGQLSSRIGTAEEQVETLNASLSVYDGFIEIKENVPSITLGKRNASDVKTKVEITGASVNLWTEDRVTAYASGQTFRAPEGSFENISMTTQAGVGNLMWIARSNGHLSLKAVN